MSFKEKIIHADEDLLYNKDYVPTGHIKYTNISELRHTCFYLLRKQGKTKFCPNGFKLLSVSVYLF